MNKIILFIALSLVAIGCIRIVATSPSLTQTYDEPAHIACGMEWIDKGIYTYEPQHPPLTRIMAAIGPYLNGSRSLNQDHMWSEGNAILYAGDYQETLGLARAGNLLFFILASIGVFAIANRLYSPLVAISSLFIFTMMPAILGNAGVATTDLGATAFFAPAITAFAYWFHKPRLGNSLLLGLLLALSVFSKFSSILFLGVSGIVLILSAMLFRRQRQDTMLNSRLIGMALIVAAIFFLTGWASYRFSIQPLFVFPRDLHWVDLFHSKFHLPKSALMKLGEIELPLTEFIRGIGAVAKHNVEGHLTYLLGETSVRGWWYYYPVILSIKIPLIILATILTGMVFIIRNMGRNAKQFHLLPLIVPVTVLLTCMFASHINIGIRHLLPIFPFLAIMGGYGIVKLIESSLVGKAAGAVCMALIALTSVSAHPDYLSFFNQIAKDKPYEYAIKCDLDWGQHLGTLVERLHERNIDELSIAYFGSADIAEHHLPNYTDVTFDTPPVMQGWLAISANGVYIKPKFSWLHQYEPVEVIRKTIFLYYFDTPVPTHE